MEPPRESHPKTNVKRLRSFLFTMGLCFVVGLALWACDNQEASYSVGDTLWGRVENLSDDELTFEFGALEEEGFEPREGSLSLQIGEAKVVSDAGEALTQKSLVEGDIVRVTIGEEGSASEVMVLRSSEAVAAEQGSARRTIVEDGNYVDNTFITAKENENSLRIDSASATFVDCDVEKSGDAEDESKAALFGLNAAVLAQHSAHVSFDGCAITSTAIGSSGVFDYGGAVSLTKTQVTTTKDQASGLVATSNGTLAAIGTTVATSGVGSPALRATAGGTVSLVGGELVTSGYDAPVIGSSASVSAEGTKLTAAHSEILVLEGPSEVNLTDCSTAGAMDANRGSHALLNVQGILLYQDGKRRSDTTVLSVKGGSLTNNAGDLMYATNTNAEITLDGVMVQNADPDALLIRAAGNDGSSGWGEQGDNGAHVNLTCAHQTLEGNLLADSSSTLSVRLTEGSSLEGAITSEAGRKDAGSVDVVVGEGSVWRLSADSKISTLENNGTIIFDGHTLTLGDGTVLGG